MTIQEVADILGVSKQRVSQLVREKRLWSRAYRTSAGVKRIDIRDAIVRPPLRKYRRRK